MMATMLEMNTTVLSAQIRAGSSGIQMPPPAVANTVRIQCESEFIVVSISTEGNTDFNGLVYPRGLSKNSSCLQEFQNQPTPIIYHLPLRSCNTMPSELKDGGIEYFNTIVVQPHLKLITNQGKGFHVRCRYQTRDKLISNDQTHAAMLQSLPLQTIAPMPGCTMKIFSSDPTGYHVAENVEIGDPLSLVITIDKQDSFGLEVSDCIVRDGLGWGEQKLINNEGCPVDNEIMGRFTYSQDKSEARVNFQAHKFPYTASVYYQCNVKLCTLHNGGCSELPSCNGVRKRRQINERFVDDAKNILSLDGTPATIEVYSGLYVNEASDISGRTDLNNDVSRQRTLNDDSICISQRSFAIGIAVAGLILMAMVIIVIVILLSRRRHKNISTTGSSIYSGPYTNTIYSQSS